MSNYYNDQWRLPNNENKDKQSNYSMDFDGSSRIDCGNDIQIFTDSHSYSFWVKKPTISESYIFGYGIDSVIIFYGDGRIRFYTGGLTSGTDFYSTTYLSTNTWYHICCTYEKNGDKKIYIDGSLDNTISTSGTIQTGGVGLTIGARNLGGSIGQYFTGQLDGICLFNYALTDGTGGTVNQIAALYGSSSTGIGNPMSLSPAPVAYYPLGDQDAFNGAEYLVPNSSLKDYVFDFDGNGYINLGNVSDFNFGTGDFTVSSWINISSGGSSYRWIFGYGQTTGLEIGLNNTTNNTLRLWIAGSLLNSSESISSNTWHNLVVKRESGSILAFLDNTPLTLGAGGAGSITNNNAYIGVWGNGASDVFNGSISNVQVFNTALSATGSNSVETLYNNGSPLTSMSGFTSLQGWWKLDASATYDGSDWTVPDDSSNSNDGTSSGMTQANLVQSDLSFKSGYSYALDFDGANDYIDCVSPSSLDFERTDAFSISAWVKRVGSGSYQSIIYKANNNSPYNGYAFYIDNNNKVGFNITIDYTSNNYFGKVCTSVLNTDWNHVLITYNGNSNVSGVNIYINGSLQTVTTAGTSSDLTGTLSNSIPFNIGARNNTDVFLNGELSNISVWNAALTSSQVTEIYNEGVPSNLNNHSAYSNLVSWWQLGSNSSFNTNWTVLDEKGSNNGTSANMIESNIVDGVNSYANGLSSGMGGDEVIGDAPYSSSNSLSVNMDVEDRTTDTPS